MSTQGNACAETAAHRAERRASAAGSLKEMIQILAAISVTNALGEFAPRFMREGVVFADVNALLCLILMIINVVRFYHGNIRLLDDTYGYETEDGGRGGMNVTSRNASLSIDFLFMFFIALLFALSSYFILQSTIFVALLAFVILIDVIWHLLAMAGNNPRAFAATKRWLVNNVLHLLFCVIGWGYVVVSNDAKGVHSFLYNETLFWLFFGFLMSNTVVDFLLSWEFYFPTQVIKP